MHLVAFLYLLVATKFADTFASEGEKRLTRHLFTEREYNRLIRPVGNSQEVVNVSFTLELFQLIRIDVKYQMMKVSVWMIQEWVDVNLAWNPNEFDGIKEFYTQPKKLWLPDIVLYNDAHGVHLDQSSTRIRVHHTGEITWKMPALLQSTCKLNMKYFPFDTQDCEMKFGSYTNDASRIDMHMKKKNVLLDNYMTNNEWRLLKTEANRNEVIYNCCVNSYTDLTFHFYYSRRSLFYITNLAFPITLITVMATVAFILPEESGERLTFSTMLMLAVTVFMLRVIEITPATSEAYPLISVYFTSCMLGAAIMIALLCLNSSLYNKKAGDRKMGDWTRRYILGYLSYIVGTQQRRDSDLVNNNQHTYNDLDESNGNISSGIINISYRKIDDNELQLATKRSPCGDKIEKIMRSFRFKDSAKLFRQEWRIVARTIDRCLFVVFSVIVTLLTVCCFSVTTYVP